MASKIRIKRSSTAGNPAVLAAGELAYSSADYDVIQGGGRLYVGAGTETEGNAANHVVIGGKYFTDMLDHAKGTLTAGSAIIVGEDSKIDVLNIDNLTIDGNTISSTDTNGNITFNPNGTGAVEVVSPETIANGSGSINIFEVLDSAGVGLFEVRQNGDAIIGGVLTVNGDGQSTFVGDVSIGGNLNVDGNATINADLFGDDLTLTGNLIVNGNTTLGNEVTDILTIVAEVDSNIVPHVDSAYSLGTTTDRWASVWADSITASNINITANTISSTNTDGDIILNPNGSGEVSVSNARIINVGAPIDDNDAATKYYVDAARSGLDIKESVRTATIDNIDIANPPVDSAGDFIIDGVSLTAGDRLLVKNQTDATQNGIYVVGGDSGSGWSLARSSDMDENFEVSGGTFAFVEEGNVNSDTGFVVTSNGNLTIGTNDIEWTLFSTSGTLIAGDGLSKDGYTLKVNTAANGGIEVVSDNLQLNSSIAGDGLSYSAGVLDVGGTANRITVTASTVDIAATYVGQTSITTLGTITTGTWQGSVIADAYIANDLTISGGTVNATPIGQSTAAAGSFTTLTASSEVDFTLTTDVTIATGSVTAAVEMSGGLAVAKSAYVGDNLIGSGVDTSEITGFTIDGGTY